MSTVKKENEEDRDFGDFLERCLDWKPERRLTPDEGFQHPWILKGIQELKARIKS